MAERLADARGPTSRSITSRCDWTKLWYNASVVVTAWRQLLAVDDAAPLASHSAFLHDVADVGAQALTNLALDAHAAAVSATLAENRTAAAAAKRFLTIVNDTEARERARLLGQ